MKSETLSRRAFLGSSAVLGITAYAAKAGDFNNLDDMAMKISRLAEGQYRLEHLCIPGLQILVVGADAEIHFCTNMTSHMSIGNVYAGFDIDRIGRIIGDYLDTCDECVRCWAIRLCSRSCYEIAAKGEQFDAELKRMVCANIRTVIERNLVYYCEALEQDPSTFAGIASPSKLKSGKDTEVAESAE